MPKKKGKNLPELKQLAKEYNQDEWEKHKPKNSYIGVCKFIKNNGIPCGNDCPCEEHQTSEAEPEETAQPVSKPFSFNAAEALAALKKPKAKPAALAQVAEPKPVQVVEAPKTQALQKKPQFAKTPYNVPATSKLPRYADSEPTSTIYYAPKAVTLIENINRLNDNDTFTYAHLIIGDTPGLAALEATSALIANGVPLVSIKPGPNGYVMSWKDDNGKENIIATATKNDKSWEYKLVPGAKAGYGVLLLSPEWPFVQKNDDLAQMMKAFSLKVMNDPSNRDGRWIRYIALDTQYKEGTDVFNVKYMHLFSPLANMADRVQTVGRGIRRCGQRYLEFIPGQGWTVEVFVYATDLKLKPDQTTSAEEAVAPQEDVNTKISHNITDMLYDNAISQVLWKCEKVSFTLVPGQRAGMKYLTRLAEWINEQSERGISEEEEKTILQDLNLLYNEVGTANDVPFEYLALVEPVIMNVIGERRDFWEISVANSIFDLENLINEISTASPERQQQIYKYIQSIWARVPEAAQHLWYSVLSQQINLNPPPPIVEPKLLTAPRQKLTSLPVPTLENLGSILQPLPEDNQLLAELRSTYLEGYQFPEWILLTTEKQNKAELWLLDPTESKAALAHSYRRVPSLDYSGVHYNEQAFSEIFPWNKDDVERAAPPLYSVYTFATVANQQGCGRAQPTFYQKQIHILHAFLLGFDSLKGIKEMVELVGQDKRVDRLYLPAFGVQLDDEREDFQKEWFRLVQTFQSVVSVTIYGPTDVDPADYGLAYDNRPFFDIFMSHEGNPLFVNNWTPFAMIGNGNCGQESLDAQIGRCTNSIALGWWGSNRDIAQRIRSYVGVEF